jgi:hypothetical protein
MRGGNSDMPFEAYCSYPWDVPDSARQSNATSSLTASQRKRFIGLICRVQQGQRERLRAMATTNLRRIVAIEFGM